VPIILATFPIVAGIEKADLIFHLVFFIALTSVVMQGTAIPWLTRLLKIGVPQLNPQVPQKPAP
jgi:cell volume regulation protein A